MGIILYEMIYGNVPFTASSLNKLFSEVSNKNIFFPENK